MCHSAAVSDVGPVFQPSEEIPNWAERSETNPCREAFLASLADSDDRVCFGAASVLMAILKVLLESRSRPWS